jgi:hypothetical protein
MNAVDMFNMWIDVNVVDMLSHFLNILNFPSLAHTHKYVEHMKNAGMLSHFWNWPPPDPITRYIQHMKAVDMLSHFLSYRPAPLQNNTLNIWIKLTCWRI